MLDDLLGQAGADDACAHREHVGVVVEPAHPGRVELVAQGGPDAADLVGGELLALADCRRGRCRGRRRPGRRPGRRRRSRPGSRPTPPSRCRGRSTSWPASARKVDEVGLHVVAGVVGPDGDPHSDLHRGRVRGREEGGRPGVDQEVGETAGQVLDLRGARQVGAPGATDGVGDVVGRDRSRRGRPGSAADRRARPASGRWGRCTARWPRPGRTSSLRVNVRANAWAGPRGVADVRAVHADDQVGAATRGRRRCGGCGGRRGRGRGGPSRRPTSSGGGRSARLRPTDCDRRRAWRARRSRWRKKASAIGERQRLPVQTKRTSDGGGL